MFTRYAIFEGTVRPGHEDEFFRAVEERLVPLWRQMPQAQAVRVVRIARRDEDAPPIAMIQEIDYPSLDAIEEALVSPVRTQARAVTDEIMALFDGRFYHVVSQRLVPA
jgi:hypothetical protein